MEELSLLVAIFIGVIVVHQVSRFIIGKVADNYPASIVMGAGIIWIVTGSTILTVSGFVLALIGHLLSVYITRTVLFKKAN